MDQSQQYSNDAATANGAGMSGTPAFGLGVNPAAGIVGPTDPQASAIPTDDSTASQIAQPDPVSLPTAPQITTTHEPNAMATSSSDSSDATDTNNQDASTPLPSEEPPVVAPSSVTTDAPVASGELEDIKKQALEELSPLVNQLDQSPEERYKTLMMLIQASDNDSLLNEAYAAAQKITDEKARAEALLNIVNEINYFAQKNAAN